MSGPPRHDGKAGYWFSHSVEATTRSSGIPGHLPPPVTPDASVGPTAPAGWTPDSLTASTTAGWTAQPAASSGEPSQQHDTLQETRQHLFRGWFPTYPPHQSFVFDVQGYTGAYYHQNYTLCPLDDPRSHVQNAPNLSTDAHATVPVHGSPTHQHAYNDGVASTQQTASPVPVQPIGYNDLPVQVPVTGPLPDGSAKLCVCSPKLWIASCPQAQEHYNSALNPSQYPCCCGWVQSEAEIPKCCPKAANHFIDWKQVPNNLLLSLLSEFGNAHATNSIAPHPETETNTLTPLPHLPRVLFTSPSNYGAYSQSRETSEPPDVDRSSHHPAGMTRDSTPARGRTASGPRNRPRKAGALVGLMDGFKNADLPPEVQQAMRQLVQAILRSKLVETHTLEPKIGSHEANTLMSGAPPELWNDYGTKGKSIYSLFIKVHEEEYIKVHRKNHIKVHKMSYECLWCGEFYPDKQERAIGHFRDKHLSHKPFTCDLVHTGDKVCNKHFSAKEAIDNHQKRMENPKQEECPNCDHDPYSSIGNRNRHSVKCLAEP